MVEVLPVNRHQRAGNRPVAEKEQIIALLLLALLAAAVLYAARLRARIAQLQARAEDYDAAVLAYAARQRWEAAVRRETGVAAAPARSS